MAHDWTKDKAEWLVDTIREQGHYYFKLEPKQARAEAEAALRDARADERKAISAQLREPDEALVEVVWATRALSRRLIPEVLRAIAAVLDHPPQQRQCTCHPDDNPPVPCAQRYAFSECVAAAALRDTSPSPPPGDNKDGGLHMTKPWIEPTTWSDGVASEMREYYERHKEPWWSRYRNSWRYSADEVMLGLLGIALERDRERREYADMPAVNDIIAGAESVSHRIGEGDIPEPVKEYLRRSLSKHGFRPPPGETT